MSYCTTRSCSGSDGSNYSTHKGQAQLQDRTRMVLPYHRCWSALGQNRKLRTLEENLGGCDDGSGRHLAPLGAAYRNAAPHLCVQSRNLHKRALRRRDAECDHAH